MKRSDVFPSNWLVAADIPTEGMNVTIHHVEEEKMRDGKAKPVIYFEEHEKGMVCNVTNWGTIENLYGDESDDWEHQRITLYPSVTTFDGDEVACIRVRKKAPKPSVAPAKNGKRDAAKSAEPARVKNVPMTQGEVDDMDDEDDADSPPF
jgi:hypothetical protein